MARKTRMARRRFYRRKIANRMGELHGKSWEFMGNLGEIVKWGNKLAHLGTTGPTWFSEIHQTAFCCAISETDISAQCMLAGSRQTSFQTS